MSPETATIRPWRNLFGERYYRVHLVLLAIDEAHCVYEWLVGINVLLDRMLLTF